MILQNVRTNLTELVLSGRDWAEAELAGVNGITIEAATPPPPLSRPHLHPNSLSEAEVGCWANEATRHCTREAAGITGGFLSDVAGDAGGHWPCEGPPYDCDGRSTLNKIWTASVSSELVDTEIQPTHTTSSFSLWIWRHHKHIGSENTTLKLVLLFESHSLKKKNPDLTEAEYKL